MTPPASDARPLAGRRVLVTRPRTQAGDLVSLLEAAGATVIVAPTIRIVPPADPEPLRRAAAEAATFDWIVFASANAVDAFLDALAATEAGELRSVAAVGVRTADQLRVRGVDVTVVPEAFTADALVSALTSRGSLRGARVLLPRSEIGRTVIADGLRAAGAAVTEVIAYRTLADVAADAPDVKGLLAARQLDAVTFTSGSAVQNFVQIHGHGSVALLQESVIAVIGPVTAEVARELGVTVHVQPATYTTAAMVEALGKYFTESQ